MPPSRRRAELCSYAGRNKATDYSTGVAVAHKAWTRALWKRLPGRGRPALGLSGAGALCASQPSGRPTATRSRRAAPEGVLVETFCCSLLPCAVKLYPCTADKPTGACSSGKHWTVGWQVTFTQSAAAYRSSLPTTSPQTGERLWPARAVLSSPCHHAQRLSRAHTENAFCVQQ